MADKNVNPQIQENESVEEVLSKSQEFVEKNQTGLLIGLGVVLALVVGVFCYINFYSEPREKAAAEALSQAEQWFVRDSFKVALEGNEDVIGFLDVIDEYGSTKSGNLANAYAGICYKKLGDFESALSYLDDFNADDEMVAPAIVGAIGDSYWDLGEQGKALSSYEKAISVDNAVISPIYMVRAAKLNMAMGENAKAVELLEKVLADYPMSPMAADAKRFLELAKAK